MADWVSWMGIYLRQTERRGEEEGEDLGAIAGWPVLARSVFKP